MSCEDVGLERGLIFRPRVGIVTTHDPHAWEVTVTATHVPHNVGFNAYVSLTYIRHTPLPETGLEP